MDILKKTALWTGIVLLGMCGVVLLGGGKITSGILLIVVAFALVLTVGRRRLPLWGNVALTALVLVVLGLVAWNVSTTDLPPKGVEAAMACSEAVDYPSTGVRLFDQAVYIFNGFAAQAAP
ncbi:hypothetical protein GCM10009830_49560 [Glycomyces endophyticus]|uniref:Uncharacterized protein n=1 Tax=Glycomyces endophyticus TaxID=480996 RepID=A0ABP4TZV7_9ACTN